MVGHINKDTQLPGVADWALRCVLKRRAKCAADRVNAETRSVRMEGFGWPAQPSRD